MLTLSLATRLTVQRTREQTARPPLPWFALGFVAVVALNSDIIIPGGAKSAIVSLATFLLTIALAAMGLETDVSKLYAAGLRPAILGALAFLFIASFSLVAIKLMG